MKLKFIVPIVVVALTLAGFFLYRNQASDKALTAPFKGSQNLFVPSPTPTPTPVVFDRNSNLEEEADKLTPEDFSSDFELLKKQVFE